MYVQKSAHIVTHSYLRRVGALTEKEGRMNALTADDRTMTKRAKKEAEDVRILLLE